MMCMHHESTQPRQQQPVRSKKYLCIAGKAIQTSSATHTEQHLFPLGLTIGDVCANDGALEHGVGKGVATVIGKVEIGASWDAGIHWEDVHKAHHQNINFSVVAIVAERLFILRTVCTCGWCTWE